MPEVAEAKPLTPSEAFTAYKANAEKTPEARAAEAPAEKKPSGDERKFRNIERRFNQQVGALKAELALALAAKPATVAATAATPDPLAAPKREDFASDEAFTDAKIAHGTAKAVAKSEAAAAEAKTVRETLEAYNAKIAAGPEKYADWAAVLAAGEGAALSVDLGKECPSLMWAIASSPYADDCFYAWLKDSKQLQGLIDTYKSGPQGEIAALTAFHRFEGRVGKDAPAKTAAAAKPPEKAQVAAPAAERVAKPKPSAEATVRGGAAAPDGKPEIYLPGTHTLNPAYKAWKYAQGGSN